MTTFKRKTKSMHGALADKNNPVLMKELLRELKEEDRREKEDDEKEMQQLRAMLKRRGKSKRVKMSLNQYVQSLIKAK